LPIIYRDIGFDTCGASYMMLKLYQNDSL